MKNKNDQFLEFWPFQPLSIESILEIVKDRKKFINIQPNSFQYNQFTEKKTHQYWISNKNSIYLPNIQNFKFAFPFFFISNKKIKLRKRPSNEHSYQAWCQLE
jgi:hypothetical protein